MNLIYANFSTNLSCDATSTYMNTVGPDISAYTNYIRPTTTVCNVHREDIRLRKAHTRHVILNH